MLRDNKCAAIVLNYNDAENAIKFSHLIESFSIIDHIIIVDNNSTDDSWSKLTKIHGEKITCYKSPKNGGYGYGNNYGVKIAKERFNCSIGFICNSDIVVPEKCFNKIANVLLDNNKSIICSAIQENGYTGKTIKATSWDVPSTFDYIRNSLMLLRHIIPEKRNNYRLPIQEVDCVPGAFLGLNINCFLKCGGYDEKVFLFCEESIIGYKAKKFGYKTFLVTNQKYYHYHSTSINKSYPKEISKYKMMIKSRKYYITNYLNVRGIKLRIVDLLLRVGVLEQRLLSVIRLKSMKSNSKN